VPRAADAFCASRPRCPVCLSENRAAYHAMRASGAHFVAIEETSRKLGRPIKRETISAHFQVCMKGKDLLGDLDTKSMSEQVERLQQGGQTDFAIAVQQKATELLNAGALKVNASHGLAAQALLDRRAEKQADRDLMLNMARLLSGAVIITPGEVIEGRVLDVTPDALLAPENVVSDR